MRIAATLAQHLLVLIILTGVSSFSHAEPISIEAPKKAFFASSDRTQTIFYPANGTAKATIIFLPGGDGYKALNDPLANTVAELSKHSFNVVVVDSPYRLTGANGWLSARLGSDHLDRIESVVAYYSKTVTTPIWLMGHSLGTGSALFFVNRSEANRKSISGLVLSGSRGDLNISERLSFPILFLHHRADACNWTLYGGARELYKRIQEQNTGKTTFITVEDGMAHPTGDPCHTGFHMYFGASKEFLDALRGELDSTLDGKEN